MVNTKRGIFLVVILALLACFGLSYLFMQHSKATQAQFEQRIQNLETEKSTLVSEQTRKFAELQSTNQTLTQQNHVLSQKLTTSLAQADNLQQQIDHLHKENQSLQSTNQTLKHNSQQKIATLAADLRHIQQEQRSLKSDYARKSLAQTKKTSVKPAPQKSIAAKAPASTDSQSSSDATATTSDGSQLSLNFPEPNGDDSAQGDPALTDPAPDSSDND